MDIPFHFTGLCLSARVTAITSLTVTVVFHKKYSKQSDRNIPGELDRMNTIWEIDLGQ